jgi:hypothetical protein
MLNALVDDLQSVVQAGISSFYQWALEQLHT